MYHGDIRLGDTIDIKFTTRQISGAPSTLGGTPVISAYVGNGTTQITAGITLTVDFDGVTGLNNVRVVATSGNGYATATNVQLVITTGTVNSVSVVGEVIATFSIEARSALMPTTAARTLVVDASGIADANIEKIDNDADAAVGMYQIGTLQFNYDHINTEANILSIGISSVTSQTIFVLDGGVATDDYYNGMLGTIQSANTPDRHYFRVVDYVGSTNTLTIDAAAPFTVNATNHEVNIIATPKQVVALPTATAGASGGLLISGSNSGTTTLGALTVTGATTLTGAVSLGSTLGITGTTTLAALTCTTLTATTNAIPWNASWDTEVQSECADALTAFGVATQSTLLTVAGYIDTEISSIITALGVIDGIVDDILVDTGTTLPAAIADVPTVAEFEARTLPTADYTIVSDLGVVQTADHTAAIADLPTNAELATALGTADDATLAQIALVKAKTDLIPAAPAAVGDIPTAAAIADAVLDEALSGHATAGTAGKALADADTRGSRVVARGTIGSGSTTTSVVSSALSPAGAVADQFKGRIIVFDNDTTTAALRGQATDITASSNSATPTFTVTALTTAPASGDTFSIL